MSNPVDIKIAHINNQENLKGSLDKDKVFEVFQRNINEVLKGLYRLQQDWVNRSYLNFNDFDTYLILMYLMNKVYVNYSDRFHYMSLEAFYSQEKVGIEKLNLIEISKDLNIPKETVRRKINYLQKNDIIVRTGKTIYLNSKGLEIQKPMATIENMASLLSKISNYLSAEDWFGKALEKEDIKKFEPELALDGGNDGLDVIKKVIYKSRIILKIKGMLALEIGNGQFKKVSKILKENKFRTKYLVKDYRENIRCIISSLEK